MEGGDDTEWLGEEPIWVVAPRVPAALAAIRKTQRIAPGCYRIGPSAYDFLWIAANELPLVPELVPFLIARSGRPLVEFARWALIHRPPQWTMRMLEVVPMQETVREELMRYLPPTDDPVRLERRRRMTRVMLDHHPELKEELVERGFKKGLDQGEFRALLFVFERRLGRPLAREEQQSLQARLRRLGPQRVGDALFRLPKSKLPAWLADSGAE